MDKVIALRIDVDTYRGTRKGVPTLRTILDRHGIKGTFYFSVGPDNMGRHLWRLFKPRFLWKMLRSKAGSLYGYDIIFMGTCWPGLQIGKRLAHVIKETAAEGHEIGLHAYDHHKAQASIATMGEAAMRKEISQGLDILARIVGRDNVVTSATPGWRTTEALLQLKEECHFHFNSDSRGPTPFYPEIGGRKLATLQVPVTLPTYDEMIGRDGVDDSNFNDRLLAMLDEHNPNVLTIHAEAEGGKCSGMFEQFITNAQANGYRFIPLGTVAEEFRSRAPTCRIVQSEFPGREGWLCCSECAQK